jgi:predicted esterase
MHSSIPFALSILLATTVALNICRASEPAPINLTPAATTDPAATLAKKRIAMLKAQPLAVTTIFDGAVFPKIDFLNKNLVEAAVGAYSLHTRFFDANWNEVAAPQAPGRYGAVINFNLADGLEFTRYLTFYKTPHPYSWTKETYGVTLKFPSAFAVPDDVISREQWNINNVASGILSVADGNDSRSATLLAALQILNNDPARWHGFNVPSIENAWWSQLRKRLGEDQDYPHLTYLPDDYDKDQRKWPLILFLHGSGERGTDLNKVKEQGPLGYIHKGHPLPFIVVTPQCPEDERWDAERLGRLLDQVTASNRVDPERIYVTGLSLGGYATCDLAATYPDRIAAIAPLSGGENPGLAQRLKKIPTWAFHGADDNVVPPRYSVDLIHALQKLGTPVKLTIYPGVGHGGWDTTYSNPQLYTWFLDHAK